MTDEVPPASPEVIAGFRRTMENLRQLTPEQFEDFLVRQEALFDLLDAMDKDEEDDGTEFCSTCRKRTKWNGAGYCSGCGNGYSISAGELGPG